MQRGLSKSSSSPSLTQLSWSRRPDPLMGTLRACPGGWSRETSKQESVKRRFPIGRCDSNPISHPQHFPSSVESASSAVVPKNDKKGNEASVVETAAESRGLKEIMVFTAARVVSGVGPSGLQSCGLRVRCFEDRLLLAQKSGGVITLPFKQITHAELDGKTSSIKLHLGMLPDSGAAYPPGPLRIELQNAADVTLLRRVVWPLLMRAVLRPREPREHGNLKLGGLSCGPSLVWSHA